MENPLCCHRLVCSRRLESPMGSVVVCLTCLASVCCQREESPLGQPGWLSSELSASTAASANYRAKHSPLPIITLLLQRGSMVL